MTNTQVKPTLEARVSRRYERLERAAGCGAQYADTVTVWTEFGAWSMPYEAFVALFGVCVAANAEGVTLNLPVHEVAKQTLPEKRKSERPDPCTQDQHCCSHHCCCFYRCKCRHQDYRHPEKGKCDFPDCPCTSYNGR